MCRMGIVKVIFRSTHNTHDRIEDTELSGSECADHHTPWDETDRAKADEAGFRGNGH